MDASPEKKKPGAGELTGRKLIALAGYHTLVFRAKVLRFVQKPFCAVCWNIEQRASKVEDRIEDERDGR
jgi:hypothetical protein